VKICIKCLIKKSLSDFHIDKRFNKPRSYCKECCKNYCKKYYYEIVAPITRKTVRVECPEGHRYCLRCKETKLLSEFYPRNGRVSNFCKLCEIAKQLGHYYANPEISKAQRKKYKDKNRQKIKERAKISRKERNHSAYSASKMKEYSIKLRDTYVKSRLRMSGILNSDITEQMVEQKRVLILIDRIKNKIEDFGFKICGECKLKLEIKQFKVRNKNNTKKPYIERICTQCYNKRASKYHKKKKNEGHNSTKTAPIRLLGKNS
jgi:hypothetical protein